MLICQGYAWAEETADPFSTAAGLSARPALHNADGTPCPPSASDQALDLPAVVRLALCNNPQTREVWANSLAQAAQVGVTQAGYLPSVSASVAANRNSPGNNQRSAGLTLSYLLFDFGARAANLENARQTLAAVAATQDATVQNVFLAAVQAYYQTQATQASFEAATVSEHAAQQSFAAAEARYQAGSATPADKFAARSAWSQSTLNRITAQGAARIAQGNLANLLGLDANQALMLASATEGGADAQAGGKRLADFEQDVAVLIEQARARRPDLRAAEATLKAAEAGADAARAAGKPTISLSATTSQTNSAGLNTHGSTLGINLTVPLFAGYAPTYRVRAAEAQIETRKAQLERIRLQVALDVWTAWQNLATATQNLRTTADLLDSASQSERVSLGRYKAGAGIMLDVLNAQNTLASARQQRIQANFNWNINRAVLAQAMGSLDEGLLTSLTDNTPQPEPTRP
ncbi:MAG: TolC family protein [Gallionella sp.]|nr:TolC family protein [Gallionella sp.]MDD4946473.1 TolC family protein [Gallionella sp.]MDD5612928.1 TolC family protein [Gallionella sp.]